MPAPTVNLNKDFQSRGDDRPTTRRLGHLEAPFGFMLGLAATFTILGWASALLFSPDHLLRLFGLI